MERGEDGSLTIDGWVDIRLASKLIDVDLVDETDRFSTLAGFILWRLGHLPQVGEIVRFEELTFEVVSLDGRNIDKIRIKRIEDAD